MSNDDGFSAFQELAGIDDQTLSWIGRAYNSEWEEIVFSFSARNIDDALEKLKTITPVGFTIFALVAEVDE